jgi:eukaryotic-like serine/threonine-protein kinase
MATAARRRSLLGEKIGNYAIVSTLGEGGMGVVYLAEHPIIGKRVAIKVLHDGHAERAEAAARCFVEARAIGGIRHPNVVDVIDCGVAELGDGPAHYLVMEHLEGRSLREELRAGALPAARAIAIAVEAGRGLAAAHARGIVHRDIKPENIFLVGTAAAGAPAVKILDFGIAKLLDGHPFGAALTQSGVTLGTPTYMAPEQLDDEDLDGRVDVYALGIVLFEMLTGAAPFAGEPTARGVWRRMNEVPALPAGLELPAGVDELLLRALDPDRARRPSMGELVRGLADPAAAAAGAADADPHTLRVARSIPRAGDPPRASKPPDGAGRSGAEAGPLRSTMRATPRPPRRWRLVAVAGLVAGGAAAALLVPRLWSGDEAAPAAPAAPREPARDEAAPRPIEPAMVAIELDSQPSSAEVFIGGERRGVTPVELALPRGAAPLPITLRRGRDEVRGELDVSRDGRLVIAFPPAARPAPAPAAASASIHPPPPVPAPAAPDAGVAAAAPPDAAPPRGLGDNLMQPRQRP